MTVHWKEDGDSLWGPCVYDGSKKGEYIKHSLDDAFSEEPLIHLANAEDRQEFITELQKEPLYKFTVVHSGETWVVPMPEGSPIPNAKVTIGWEPTEQLVIEKKPNMTPKQLLDLVLLNNSTLRDVLEVYQNEGQFCNNPTEMDEQETEAFFLDLAQRIIEKMKLT